MSEYAFGLVKPQDMIDKLEREIGRLVASETNSNIDHKHQADHAFNCAVTAWHITDWMHVAQLRTASVNSKSLGNFQKQLIDDCFELGICKDLANGSKHFKIDKPDKSIVSKTLNKKTVGGGILQPVVQPILGPVVSSVFGGYQVLEVQVLLKNGANIKASLFFKAVHKYWRQFLSDASTHNIHP